MRKMRPRKRKSVRRIRVRVALKPSNFDDEVLLAEREVAAWLGCATVTLRAWRRQERGPAFIRLQGRPRYAAGVVRQWLAARSVPNRTCVEKTPKPFGDCAPAEPNPPRGDMDK